MRFRALLLCVALAACAKSFDRSALVVDPPPDASRQRDDARPPPDAGPTTRAALPTVELLAPNGLIHQSPASGGIFVQAWQETTGRPAEDAHGTRTFAFDSGDNFVQVSAQGDGLSPWSLEPLWTAPNSIHALGGGTEAPLLVGWSRDLVVDGDDVAGGFLGRFGLDGAFELLRTSLPPVETAVGLDDDKMAVVLLDDEPFAQVAGQDLEAETRAAIALVDAAEGVQWVRAVHGVDRTWSPRVTYADGRIVFVARPPQHQGADAEPVVASWRRSGEPVFEISLPFASWERADQVAVTEEGDVFLALRPAAYAGAPLALNDPLLLVRVDSQGAVHSREIGEGRISRIRRLTDGVLATVETRTAGNQVGGPFLHVARFSTDLQEARIPLAPPSRDWNDHTLQRHDNGYWLALYWRDRVWIAQFDEAGEPLDTFETTIADGEVFIHDAELEGDALYLLVTHGDADYRLHRIQGGHSRSVEIATTRGGFDYSSLEVSDGRIGVVVGPALSLTVAGETQEFEVMTSAYLRVPSIL